MAGEIPDKVKLLEPELSGWWIAGAILGVGVLGIAFKAGGALADYAWNAATEGLAMVSPKAAAAVQQAAPAAATAYYDMSGGVVG